jgi:hypothetical protein
MGANKTAGAISVYKLIDATVQPLIFPSRGDDGILLEDIPAIVDELPTCVITLPDNPATGDTYFIADNDGSAGPENVALILPGDATSGESTINGTTGFAFLQAFVGAWFIYSADDNNWTVALTDTAAFILSTNMAGTFQNTASPATSLVSAGNMAAPASLALAALNVRPKSSGIFRVVGYVSCIVSAAGTVAFEWTAESGLTAATSGGTNFGGDGVAPSINIESGSGAGEPVVVPFTTQSVQGAVQREVPAAEAGGANLVVFPINGTANVPDAGEFPCAITVRATSAENLSGIELNLSAQECF